MATTLNHGGSWTYSVPLDDDGNLDPRPTAQRADTGGWEKERDRERARERASSTTGKSVQRRSSAFDLMSDSETAKQRRTSMRQSNVAAGRKRSKNQLRDKRLQDDVPQERVDDSAWIHRDKLAQIEIKEMEEAGFYRPSARRSESEGPARHRTSRSLSRSRPSSRTDEQRQQEITNDQDYAAAYPGYEEPPRKRVSTVPSAPEEEQESEPVYELAPQTKEPMRKSFDPYRDSQFQESEAIAAQLRAQRQQQQNGARPGTSRIPVSRVSPVPVPSQVVDRDQPLPRSRAGSQNWAGSFDELQYARKARSGSMSSQVLLDSDRDGQRTTPPGSSNKHSSNDENSPPKSQIPKKQGPSGRKASTSSATAARPGSSHQNKRAPSASGTTRRPGSSSGHKNRLSTGYAPDGEAPWITSMYKPDPRLPPDQQMLPTHAKRMMQEQWEKEGKTGTVYDRDFNLLSDADFPKPPVLSLDSHNLAPPLESTSPTKDRPSPNGSANGGPWPLSPVKSDTKSEAGSARPSTSGGYKITPTIQDTPNFQRSPLHSPAPPPLSLPAHNPTPRVPEVSEKDEAAPKKGCCCVVM